jgi:hypothetical protein
MVALVVVHELIGPVLFKTALSQAGEVGAMDKHAEMHASLAR